MVLADQRPDLISQYEIYLSPDGRSDGGTISLPGLL